MNLRSLAVIAVAAALSACATMGPPPKAYSPDEIVSMAKTGKKPAEIVQTLRDSHVYYALPASELARISKEGVPDEVLNYLQASHLEAVRYAERQQWALNTPFWYGGLYGPRFCYRSSGGRFGWVTCF